jgi:glucokinase
MILAGDIGGTKTVVALYEKLGQELRLVRDATYKSKEFKSLEDILVKFLKEDGSRTPKAGCFGVAGAVLGGKSKITNLPWFLDEHKLADAIGAPRVKLLNDLEATAYGMLFLSPEDFTILNPGNPEPRTGNCAVIAAGTGLGEGMLYWDAKQHHPLASEGGHADFAPRTDQEIDLLRYLRDKFKGHISYERVLSGPGSFNIYTFLRDRGYYPEPPWLAEKLQSGDKSSTITKIGLAGQDPLCVASLDLFATLYGAEAGNLALKCVAVGGVFVGGGIAPKMLPVLQNGSFMRGFTEKGRFSDLLKSIPVRVALNPRAPLIGAAHFGLRL